MLPFNGTCLKKKILFVSRLLVNFYIITSLFTLSGKLDTVKHAIKEEKAGAGGHKFGNLDQPV